LGLDPDSGLPIFVLGGRFGPYLQLGEVQEDGPKPRRASIPKNIAPATITLEAALKLLSLPRTVGDHPETGKPVKAGIGRFGPYVVHEAPQKVYKSFGPGGSFEHDGRRYDVFNVDLPTAIEMLKQARKRASATPLRELGQHPEDGSTIAIFEGRYGPYVKYGAVNVTIPKGMTIEEVRLEQVVEWAADKIARDGGVPRRKRAAKPAKNGRPPAAPKRAKSVGPKKKTPPKKANCEKANPTDCALQRIACQFPDG